MNDPWTLFVAALSGQRTATPSTWPARTVHRLDNFSPADRASQPPERRAPPRQTPTTLAALAR